jgi:hypothetical protein
MNVIYRIVIPPQTILAVITLNFRTALHQRLGDVEEEVCSFLPGIHQGVSPVMGGQRDAVSLPAHLHTPLQHP